MVNKILLITLGIIFLSGIVVSFTQITDSLIFDKDKIDILTLTGINNPIISSCIKQDEYTCKSNIYEESGINKEIEVTTKFCDTYEIIYSNGECLNYSLTEEQGDCISWEENQTECLEYETIQIQGDCLNYEIIETQGNCSSWKTLTQLKIENELINKTNILLKNIADVQKDRIKVSEILTDEIMIEIREEVRKE